jgi:hypothetical protein
VQLYRWAVRFCFIAYCRDCLWGGPATPGHGFAPCRNTRLAPLRTTRAACTPHLSRVCDWGSLRYFHYDLVALWRSVPFSSYYNSSRCWRDGRTRGIRLLSPGGEIYLIVGGSFLAHLKNLPYIKHHIVFSRAYTRRTKPSRTSFTVHSPVYVVYPLPFSLCHAPCAACFRRALYAPRCCLPVTT